MWALGLSGAQYDRREAKEGCCHAIAGVTLRGEQTVQRAAGLCRCDTRRGIGGQQDSIARMLVGVEKQFVVHLCTLCQRVLSLVIEPALRVKRSAP